MGRKLQATFVLPFTHSVDIDTETVLIIVLTNWIELLLQYMN